MYFGSITPHITIPTKTNQHFRKLTDKIFADTADQRSINSNLICSISYRLAQFLIFSEHNSNNCKNKKQNIKETI